VRVELRFTSVKSGRLLPGAGPRTMLSVGWRDCGACRSSASAGLQFPGRVLLKFGVRIGGLQLTKWNFH